MEKKQNSLVLSSSMGKVKLPLLDVSEFLTLKKEVTGIEINKNLFNFSKLRQVVFSSSSDESRPVLTGICFDFLENETKIVGTDGFRLSLETIKTKSGDTSLDRIIISGKSIISLAKVFGNKLEKVLYDNSEKQLMFFGEENTVAVRLLEGEFPPYDKVIPKQAKTSIVFKRKDLINSLKTASLFAKEGSNMLLVEIVDKNLIISSSNASTGEAEFKTPLISKEGENNKITFNYKYLLDFLNIIEEKEITFEMTNSFAPGVFKKASNNDYLHIIMPIRSQE